MRFMSLRGVFLLGFVVAMPVLALPPVARRIDELLYGRLPTELGKTAVEPAPKSNPTEIARGAPRPRRSDTNAGDRPLGDHHRGLAPRTDISPADVAGRSPELLVAS